MRNHIEPLDWTPFFKALDGFIGWLEVQRKKAEQLCAEDKPHTLISSKNPCKHFKG